MFQSPALGSFLNGSQESFASLKSEQDSSLIPNEVSLRFHVNFLRNVCLCVSVFQCLCIMIVLLQVQ